MNNNEKENWQGSETNANRFIYLQNISNEISNISFPYSIPNIIINNIDDNFFSLESQKYLYKLIIFTRENLNLFKNKFAKKFGGNIE